MTNILSSPKNRNLMKALIIGATGLSGSALVQLLLSDSNYTEIHLLVRKVSGLSHPKLTEHQVDFRDEQQLKSLLTGDVLFSAMGTTRKQAQSKEAQYEVDFTFQYRCAKLAADNGMRNYVLVSSVGADAQSSLFYPRIKGELEEAIGKLPFERIRILRPGPLTGKRRENRVMESIGVAVVRFFNQLGLLRSYTPATGHDIACALRNSVENQPEKREVIYTLYEVHELAGQNRS
jgi:uncharacterized protein YbjT (DUF2867 family)